MRAIRTGLMPLIAGFTIWSLGFVALYGLNAVGCAMGWHVLGSDPFTPQRLMLVAVFLATLAGVGALAFAQGRQVRMHPQGREALILRAGYWASLAALASTLFTFAPVFVLSTCI